MANEQNLRPQSTRSKSEQREIARKGGIASGEARREKKLLSQNYAEWLIKEHNIDLDGKKLKIEGEDLLEKAITKIILRGDSSSVRMMKEIREATEGSRVKLEKSIDINYDDPKIQELLKKYGIRRSN